MKQKFPYSQVDVAKLKEQFPKAVKEVADPSMVQALIKVEHKILMLPPKEHAPKFLQQDAQSARTKSEAEALNESLARKGV